MSRPRLPAALSAASVVSACLLLAACQTTESSGAAALVATGPDQLQRVSQNGQLTVFSPGRSVDVAIRVADDESWREFGQSFFVKIRNRGAASVRIDGSSISAKQEYNSAVEVLDYQGMRAALNKRQETEESAAMLGQMFGGAAVGLSAASRNPVGRAALAAGGVTAWQIASQNLVQSKANAIVDDAELPKSFIGRGFVGPGEEVGGRILVRNLDGNGAITIEVAVGGDRHVVGLKR